MTALLLAVGILSLGVLAVPYAGGALLATRRGWAPSDAAVAGLVALGACGGIMLLSVWVAPAALVPTALLLGALSVGGIVAARREWRVLVVPALLSVGALLVAAGLGLLWGLRDSAFSTAEQRFASGPLPWDDRLPADLASWFASSERPVLVQGDWLPSDRPPLQSGLLLLLRPLLRVVGRLSAAAPGDLDWVAGVAIQVVWIPVCLALLLAVGHAGRIATATAAVTALTSFAFVNTVFTWPKLLSAAFAVAAVAVSVSTIRRRSGLVRGLVLAAVCSAFALLAHGGAAFLLPLIGVLAIVAVIRVPGRRVPAVAAALAAGAVLWAPWFAFQRLIAPPGDRLLKWHLAGVTGVDGRSFARTLLDQYRATPLEDVIAARLQNLRIAFDPALAASSLDVFQPAGAAGRVTTEFFHLPAALGLGYPLAVAVLVVWAVQRSRRRDGPVLRWSAALVAGSVGCVALWCLVMFSPGSAVVHQGSLAWLVLLFAVPFAMLVRWSALAGAVAAVLVVACTLLLYAPPVAAEAVPRAPAVAAVILGLAVLGVSVPAAGRRAPRAATDSPVSVAVEPERVA